MRLRWRRRSETDALATEYDGLDGRNWKIVVESATAAHRGDPDDHGAPLMRVAVKDATPGLYLQYLLRYRVAAILGRRPTADDLHDLTDRFYPDFAKIIRGDRTQLEDTLLTVFDLVPEEDAVDGPMGVILGSAALGVLLEDPDADLAAMRPPLAKWWATRDDAPPPGGSTSR